MSFGVIGGADGPTAVLVAEEVGFDWINILLGNGALLLVYWIIWVLFFIKQDKWKKMTLAVIPACIFLLSGWMLEQWALVISAIAFCVAHIYVTKENMK